MLLLVMLVFTSLMGVLAIGIGVCFLVQRFNRRDWQSFQGEIIAVEASFTGDGTVYHPIIRVCHGVESYEFRSEMGSYPAPKVGRMRRVRGHLETEQFADAGVGVTLLTILLPILAGVGIVLLGWGIFLDNRDLGEGSAVERGEARALEIKLSF